MLFLSPDIVYWLQTLLHSRENNTVFIVDVSRVCKLTFSEERQETKPKRTHTAFLKIFRTTIQYKTFMMRIPRFISILWKLLKFQNCCVMFRNFLGRQMPPPDCAPNIQIHALSHCVSALANISTSLFRRRAFIHGECIWASMFVHSCCVRSGQCSLTIDMMAC